MPSLSKGEDGLFREWARRNYAPGKDISGKWHPVVQDECVKINAESVGYRFCRYERNPIDANGAIKEEVTQVTKVEEISGVERLDLDLSQERAQDHG